MEYQLIKNTTAVAERFLTVFKCTKQSKEIVMRSTMILSGAMALFAIAHTAWAGQEIDFIHFFRGDANNTQSVNDADATFILAYLHTGGPAPSCDDAADANDDGAIDNSDPIYILN